MLKKGGSNWVEGSRFFDREAELETLQERVRDGTHTLLTATAVNGRLAGPAVDRYRDHFSAGEQDSMLSVRDVLHVLCHDGYLYRQDDGYRFVSGLLEDWWRSRYGQHFVSVLHPEVNPRDPGR